MKTQAGHRNLTKTEVRKTVLCLIFQNLQLLIELNLQRAYPLIFIND